MRAVHAFTRGSAAPAIFVGCCGARKSLKEYSKIFNTLEVQSTFYRLPRKETAEKWRKEVPKGFVFSVKCFQGVTHPCTSPTWRRYGGKPEGRKGNYGLLQPTDEVFSSWERTKEICNFLIPFKRGCQHTHHYERRNHNRNNDEHRRNQRRSTVHICLLSEMY